MPLAGTYPLSLFSHTPILCMPRLLACHHVVSGF